MTKNTKRHTARLAAVQGLYQMEQSEAVAQRVVQDMISSGFSSLEGYAKPDVEFFEDLMFSSSLIEGELDGIITPYLAENWRMERLASVLRMILRLGTFELKNHLSTPENIIINEYIEIAKDFFPDGKESQFINGVLDKVSKELRKKI